MMPTWSPTASYPLAAFKPNSSNGAYSDHTQQPKKKRKRADAAQLMVLNETYNQTPYPSTEERDWLALRLNMSARSVQIW